MSDPAPGLPAAEPTPRGAVPRAGLRYAALRTSLLLSVGLVLYVIGLRGWLLLVLAFVLSGVVSYFVLMQQRDVAAAGLERRVESWRARRHDEQALADAASDVTDAHATPADEADRSERAGG